MQVAKHPTELPNLWPIFVGQSLSAVRRQVLVSEHKNLPAEVRDEDSDGATEIEFSNGRKLHFVPITETMSVGVGEGEMPMWGDSYKTVNATENEFWGSRIGPRIQAIFVLEPPSQPTTLPGDDEHCEFGLEFLLEDGATFAVVFGGQEDADSLRIMSSIPEGTRQQIAP